MPVPVIARVEFTKAKAQEWAMVLRHNQGHMYRSIRVYERRLNAGGAYADVYVVVTIAR